MTKTCKTYIADREEGMTLLELMFAAGVVVIALVFVFGSIFSMHQVGNLSEDRATATTEIASVLEEVRGLNYSQLLAYNPPAPGALGDNVALEIKCFDTAGNEVILPTDEDSLTDPLPNPCEVQVTIQWLDRAGRTTSASSSAIVRR